MRARLFVLLIWFCLPLQWAGLAVADSCVHPACSVVVQAQAGGQGDAEAALSASAHSHCGGCHGAALALSPGRGLATDTVGQRVWAWPRPWVEALRVERPERPQWPPLA
jgi:mono/diheme cytochrome c family protein